MDKNDRVDGGWLERLAEQLERVCAGEKEVEIKLDTSSPGGRRLEAALAQLVDRYQVNLQDIDGFHESSMELALGLSETFSVLDALRTGDMGIRASAEMLESSNELIAQLAQAVNATTAGMQQRMETILRQQEAIHELSTPVLQLWDDVLALPIVGIVDSTRTADIMDRLLAEIVRSQSKCVILDITGVDVVDTRTADNFIKMVKAAELVGARCVLTGISPGVAQTLVDIGVDLGSVVTLRNLQDGLRECIRYLETRRGGRADHKANGQS